MPEGQPPMGRPMSWGGLGKMVVGVGGEDEEIVYEELSSKNWRKDSHVNEGRLR